MSFFLLLTERYAWMKQGWVKDVIQDRKAHQLIPEILNSHEMYHQEAKENTFHGVHIMMKTGRHAW